MVGGTRAKLALSGKGKEAGIPQKASYANPDHGIFKSRKKERMMQEKKRKISNDHTEDIAIFLNPGTKDGGGRRA